MFAISRIVFDLNYLPMFSYRLDLLSSELHRTGTSFKLVSFRQMVYVFVRIAYLKLDLFRLSCLEYSMLILESIYRSRVKSVNFIHNTIKHKSFTLFINEFIYFRDGFSETLESFFVLIPWVRISYSFSHVFFLSKNGQYLVINHVEYWS